MAAFQTKIIVNWNYKIMVLIAAFQSKIFLKVKYRIIV